MPITPQSLEIQSFKAHTYAGSAVAVLLANSAQQWVHEGEHYDQSTPKERSYLVSNGFEDGVMELFAGKHREGVYDGQAFATPAGAASETQRGIRYAERHFGQKGLKHSLVTRLPGGVVIGQFLAGMHGGTGNVFFSVGRCAFVVADRVTTASTRCEAWAPVVDESRRIAQQARSVCE